MSARRRQDEVQSGRDGLRPRREPSPRRAKPWPTPMSWRLGGSLKTGRLQGLVAKGLEGRTWLELAAGSVVR